MFELWKPTRTRNPEKRTCEISAPGVRVILTVGRRLRRASREQIVMVAGRQGRVQLRRRGAREAGGERGRREVGATAPARPRRIRGGMRVSPRVMRRELAHVCRNDRRTNRFITSHKSYQ